MGSACSYHAALLPLCSVEEALGRSQPGGSGQLCSVQPSDNATQNCQANFTCVPLPDLVMHWGVSTLALAWIHVTRMPAVL